MKRIKIILLAAVLSYIVVLSCAAAATISLLDDAPQRLYNDAQQVIKAGSKSSVLNYLISSNAGYTCYEIITEESDNRFECLRVKQEEINGYHFVLDFTDTGAINWFTAQEIFILETADNEIRARYDETTWLYSTETKTNEVAEKTIELIGSTNTFETFLENGYTQTVFIGADRFPGGFQYIGIAAVPQN